MGRRVFLPALWCALLVLPVAAAADARLDTRPEDKSGAAPTDTPAGKWGLEQLMQRRSLLSSSRADFSEIRKYPTAELTTQSSGVLIYQAPDRLERQTSKPAAQRVIVQGERVTLESETDNGKPLRREFALGDIPGLRPLFRALRAVLGGDLANLRQQFTVNFTGDENEWRLTLVPRERADQHVREIVFTGRAAEILGIDMNQKNGDSSHTVLNPQPPAPPAEKPPAAPAPTSAPVPAGSDTGS